MTATQFVVVGLIALSFLTGWWMGVRQREQRSTASRSAHDSADEPSHAARASQNGAGLEDGALASLRRAQVLCERVIETPGERRRDADLARLDAAVEDVETWTDRLDDRVDGPFLLAYDQAANALVGVQHLLASADPLASDEATERALQRHIAALGEARRSLDATLNTG